MSISELYKSLGGSSIEPIRSPVGRDARAEIPKAGKSEFEVVLQEQQLSFSQHAEARIRSRNIPWDSQLEKRILTGIDQAQSKGSRETLILADNVAVIANVKSRTVITAMDKSQMKEKIFTNIDSTVLV